MVARFTCLLWGSILVRVLDTVNLTSLMAEVLRTTAVLHKNLEDEFMGLVKEGKGAVKFLEIGEDNSIDE